MASPYNKGSEYLINIYLQQESDSQGKNTTQVIQSGDSMLKANALLTYPCRVCGNTTYYIEDIDKILCDLVLGAQLYNFQHPRSAIEFRIQVLYPRSFCDSSYLEIVKSMISTASQNGCHVDIDICDENVSEQVDHTKGDAYAMNKGYEIKCQSFSNFLESNGQNVQNEFVRSSGRKNALDYAHPIDAKIIRILDNPVVNQVFSKLVNLGTDMSYGLVLSTGIRMDNRPSEIAESLRKCAETLKISVPYTVISSSVSGLNAMTVGSDEENCIAVGSLLKALMTPGELTFVLGHECGHIALGHVLYHSVMSTIQNTAELIPLIGHSIYQLVAWPLMAWHRRSEISADRAGLLCCGDVDVACKALLKLESGFMGIEDLDIDQYIQNTNHQLEHSALGKYAELLHEHPILAKRMEALKLFAKSEKYYRLSGKDIPSGADLISDSELDTRTENIIQIMN